MTHPDKPFAESCAENQQVILETIAPLLRERREVLEIGSGTGQHAVHFAAAMPHLRWQTTELAPHHAGIRLWIEDAGLANVLPPLELDVSGESWPAGSYDAVFSANTAHIMSWSQVQAMFAGVGRLLRPGGLCMLYGPFNYGGRYTSESNGRFDRWLKQRDPLSGVRDFEALDRLAQTRGMDLAADYEMPVNNRTLVWQRR